MEGFPFMAIGTPEEFNINSPGLQPGVKRLHNQTAGTAKLI